MIYTKDIPYALQPDPKGLDDMAHEIMQRGVEVIGGHVEVIGLIQDDERCQLAVSFLGRFGMLSEVHLPLVL